MDEADGIGGSGALEGLLGSVVGEDVTVGEFDGVAGQGEIAGVGAPGGAGHLLPLVFEGGSGGGGEGDAGVGGPGAGGVEGSGVLRAVFRVDGDAGAGTLEEGGEGEAEGSAADDGYLLGGGGSAGGSEREVDRMYGRAPGERPAGAAVAVVVDDELAADAFGFDAWPLGAERTGADGDFGEAVGVGVDEGERWDGVAGGEGVGDVARGAAGEQAVGADGSGGRLLVGHDMSGWFGWNPGLRCETWGTRVGSGSD